MIKLNKMFRSFPQTKLNWIDRQLRIQWRHGMRGALLRWPVHDICGILSSSLHISQNWFTYRSSTTETCLDKQVKPTLNFKAQRRTKQQNHMVNNSVVSSLFELWLEACVFLKIEIGGKTCLYFQWRGIQKSIDRLLIRNTRKNPMQFQQTKLLDFPSTIKLYVIH